MLLFAMPGVGRAQQAGERPTLTLEALFASNTFEGASFEGGRWAEAGPVVTYVAQDPATDATHLMSYNLETNRQERLIDGTTLRAADVGRLIQIEDYQYSRDGRRVLLYTDSERVWRQNTKGYYYVYDLLARQATPLSDRAKGFQMFAKLSPAGDRVAFVRNRNLFMVDLATMQETALTDDGAEGTVINGTSDWVYEEEFGLRDGWAWSPDGRYIAFLQLDETQTRAFEMADLRGQYPSVTTFRYPKAGEANSEIRVGVIDVGTGERRFFDTGTWEAGGDSLEYIPQMNWTPEIDGTAYVWMFRLNRDQNKLDLLYGDPATGAVRLVMKDRDDAWLDVETGFSDLDVGNLTYLDDGKHFVWISERDGYRHLYLYEHDGTLVRQLTSGAWDVTAFHGIDEARGAVYFTATVESPLERHLYRAPFATEAEGASERRAAPVKITQQPGWHGVDLSRDLRYYIDTYSNSTTPPVVTLHRIDGTAVKVLEDNAVLIETLQAYALPSVAFTTVPGADGTPLNAYVIKPRDFDPEKKYPLLLHVYGGPGSQEVRNQWGGVERLWHMMLADDLGVIIGGVDNRGTGGRGKAFQAAPYKRLGILEAQDQIAAARHFGQQAYVDSTRMGIWGWSYGGFMTLLSMLYDGGPQTFKVGMAVAPVTDWRLYDTIYTERYMSTPQKNPAGYEEGSPIHYADRLRDDQHLLIVHGDLDDNVHFQNTVQMVDALQQANKQFSLMIYPGRNHRIAGGNAQLHLYTLLTDFIKENL